MPVQNAGSAGIVTENHEVFTQDARRLGKLYQFLRQADWMPEPTKVFTTGFARLRLSRLRVVLWRLQKIVATEGDVRWEGITLRFLV